jgi:hypothetical protein
MKEGYDCVFGSRFMRRGAMTNGNLQGSIRSQAV